MQNSYGLIVSHRATEPFSRRAFRNTNVAEPALVTGAGLFYGRREMHVFGNQVVDVAEHPDEMDDFQSDDDDQ